MPELTRQQKITFGEMRESGVDRILIYCADYKCSHSTAMSADRWPDDVRLSDIEPRFTCRACGKRGARRSGTIPAGQDGHGLMRFTADRPYADPEKAARKLVEIANQVRRSAGSYGLRRAAPRSDHAGGYLPSVSSFFFSSSFIFLTVGLWLLAPVV
jgi:hypothetical protein